MTNPPALLRDRGAIARKYSHERAALSARVTGDRRTQPQSRSELDRSALQRRCRPVGAGRRTLQPMQTAATQSPDLREVPGTDQPGRHAHITWPKTIAISLAIAAAATVLDLTGHAGGAGHGAQPHQPPAINWFGTTIRRHTPHLAAGISTVDSHQEGN